MFDRGQHSVGAGTANVSGNEVADWLRVLAEGTRIDDGVGWVGVDISVRKEIPVHADGASLLRGNAAEGFRILQFAGSSECHGMGEFGGAVDSHGHSALEIRRNQQRDWGILLQAVQQLRGFVGLGAVEKRRVPSNRHSESAEVVFAYAVAKLEI